MSLYPILVSYSVTGGVCSASVVVVVVASVVVVVVVSVVVVVDSVDSVVSAGVSFTVVVVDSVDEETLDEDADEGTVVLPETLLDVLFDVLFDVLTDVLLLPVNVVLIPSKDGRVVLPPSMVVSSQSNVHVVVVVVGLLGVIAIPPE